MRDSRVRTVYGAEPLTTGSGYGFSAVPGSAMR